MGDTGALKPEVFSIQGFIKDTEAEKKGVSTEEQILARGATTPFWKALQKHINNQIEVLEAINDAAISNGMPLEEIGRNTIVISQTRGVIRKIFNVVTDAQDAVEDGQK